MKRAAVLQRSVWSMWLVGAALCGGLVTAAQTPAQRPAETASAMAAEPELLRVNVVRVKPDLLTEWQEFQRTETLPALQKAGVKWRDAWSTVIGEGFEYAFVTPMANFASGDQPNPIVKALGEEGARAHGAKNRKFIATSRSYVIRTRPDLSYAPRPNERTPLAVISSISITPGRMDDYAQFVKNEILPIQKKAQVEGYLVSQTIFGGDGNEFVTLSLVKTFADLDKGPAVVRVLGPEGAAKLTAKSAGMVTHVERTVMRYVTDLSFRTGTPSTSPSK